MNYTIVRYKNKFICKL